MTVKSTQARATPAVSAAPADQCTRIATNQIGPVGAHQEPPEILPNNTWRGDDSGATGRHEAWLYEDLDGVNFQQYILMQNVSGSFIDGEGLGVAT